MRSVFIVRAMSSNWHQTKLLQSVDDRTDQPLNVPVSGITKMSIASIPAYVRSQMIEPAANGHDLETAPTFWQDGLFKPVVQIIGQHFNQEKQLIAFEIALAVLVKSKAFLELINLVFNIAALIVVMKDLSGCHSLDIGHDKLVAIFHSVKVHLLLFFIFDRSRFAYQDEPVAFLPLRQSEMAFVNTKGFINIRPGIKMILVIDTVNEHLQTLVFFALDRELQILLIQIRQVVDVKSAAVDAHALEYPCVRQEDAAFADKRFQLVIGMMSAIL